jgi:fosfomycin resistance protein FosX
MIQGISHITFIVSDLDRMAQLLKSIFGGTEVYCSGDEQFSLSREKFFIVNDVWIAIMEGPPLPVKTYNHVAFQIKDEDFNDYAEKIKGLGLEVREARSRIPGEGQSLYFYDHDNHLFELHTGTLDERLESYSKNTHNPLAAKQ